VRDESTQRRRAAVVVVAADVERDDGAVGETGVQNAVVVAEN
jgi:hypothetical protein